MSRISKLLPYLFYALWGISLVLGYRAAVVLKSWNQDVFFTGLSAGIFLWVGGDKIRHWLAQYEKGLGAKEKELRQIIWRLEGIRKRLRKPQ